jgi:hypothetical protein
MPNIMYPSRLKPNPRIGPVNLDMGPDVEPMPVAAPRAPVIPQMPEIIPMNLPPLEPANNPEASDPLSALSALGMKRAMNILMPKKKGAGSVPLLHESLHT